MEFSPRPEAETAVSTTGAGRAGGRDVGGEIFVWLRSRWEEETVVALDRKIAVISEPARDAAE
jgi:hypothetical protein